MRLVETFKSQSYKRETGSYKFPLTH